MGCSSRLAVGQTSRFRHRSALHPSLLRGDASFGNEPIMHEAEQRGLAYLFKLRLTANVQRAIERLSSEREWVDAGQGWRAKESAVRLAGWSQTASHHRVAPAREGRLGGVIEARPRPAATVFPRDR